MNIKNIYKVKSVKYLACAFTKCPLGDDWSKMHIEINATIGAEFPNYDEVDQFIQQKIDNHTYIIEEVGYKVYEFFKALCHPVQLSVIIYNDNNSFSTTYITIEE